MSGYQMVKTFDDTSNCFGTLSVIDGRTELSKSIISSQAVIMGHQVCFRKVLYAAIDSRSLAVVHKI